MLGRKYRYLRASWLLGKSNSRLLPWLILLLCVAVVYWSALLSAHQHMRKNAQIEAWLRVSQVSRAVSMQVSALMNGLDYLTQDLSLSYEQGSVADFERAARSSVVAYPSSPIIQVAVADADGRVIYSTLANEAGNLAGQISIKDREHFRVHVDRPAAGMYISRPVLGRSSGKWSIQLSRALRRNGVFVGVLVVSLSAEYISNQLQSSFDGLDDVIMLLREDGAYLARSRLSGDAYGEKLDEQQMRFFNLGSASGIYDAKTDIDGVDRMYFWIRVPGYPLLVNSGLGKDVLFLALEGTIRKNIFVNIVGTIVIFLGALFSFWLLMQKQKEARRRIDAEFSFLKLADQFPGGLFQYEQRGGEGSHLSFFNSDLLVLHGVSDDASLVGGIRSLARWVDSDDLEGLRTSITNALDSGHEWEYRYRINRSDAPVQWLMGRATCHINQSGGRVWLGYILDITRDVILQEATKRNEERLRLTFDALRDGLWQFDCKRDVMRWDVRCYEMLGESGTEELCLKLAQYLQRIHPRDRVAASQCLFEHLKNEALPFRIEVRMRTGEGRWRWIEVRGEVIQRSPDGVALRMLGTHSDIQERIEQAQMSRALLDRGSSLVMVASPSRTIVYANERASQYFGLHKGRFAKNLSFEALHADVDSFQKFSYLYDQLRREGSVRVEWALKKFNNELNWFDMQGTLLDPDEVDGDVIWTLIDIKDRHESEIGLQQAQNRMGAVIEHFPSGVVVSDSWGGKVLSVNDVFLKIMAVQDPASFWIGGDIGLLFEGMPDDFLRVFEKKSETIIEGSPFHSRGAFISRDNNRHIEFEVINLLDAEDSLGICWVFHDVTTHKRRESQLSLLASTDALTGVSNRRAFIEQLEQNIEYFRLQSSSAMALIMLDIDHFKSVNDSFGHPVGDEVLKQLAITVKKFMRKGDLFGRLGGEEFALLIVDANSAIAFRRAEELRKAIEADAVVATTGDLINFTVSMGVYEINVLSDSAAECLQKVDSALYYSKRHGRNRSTVWSECLQDSGVARL